MHSFPLHWIPLLPLLGAAVNLLFGRSMSRRAVHFVAVASVASACVVSLVAIFGSGHVFSLWNAARHGTAGAAPVLHERWFTWIAVGNLHIDMAFTLDTLSAVMIFTVTFVGTLIHIYSTGYMAHDKRYAAYFGYLNLFTGAMLLLVLGDSLPVMFIGWEGVGLCSYLLIGFWFDKEKNANAGRKAFVVNRIGDFAFLLGIFLLFAQTKQVSFAGLSGATAQLAAPLGGPGHLPLAFWAGLLLFIGACGKSAQIPLYVWLPDAMAGPTPVSALIHAATMVTAGVYMVARLGFLYLSAPQVMMIVAGVGTLTAVWAAIIGFAQTDIKKVLAYSTVSQLGFMFAAVGCGAFGAGIFHLFTHAFFKAGLFLAAGSVMHAMGDRTEIMEMGGLRKKIPITHWTFAVYCVAIAGIPPLAGFFSKDEILLSAFTVQFPGVWPSWFGKWVIWLPLSAAALGTAFYMWRLYFLVFWGESRADAETQRHIHESPRSMTMPLQVLAVGAIVLGLLGIPHLIDFLHVGNFMHSWLGGTFDNWGGGVRVPTPHVGVGTEWFLMGFATALGMLGIYLAYLAYGSGPEKVRGLVASIAPLHKLVANKFYVDELYDLILVRPFRWIAALLKNLVDPIIVDGSIAKVTPTVVDVTGRVSRWWQNGDVQRYFAAMVVGLAGIFMVTQNSCWIGDHPSIRANVAGNQVTFAVDIGGGPGAKGATYKWDFDEDGTPDATTAEATYTFKQPGKHKVKLVVENRLNRVELQKTVVTITGGGK